MAEGSGTTSGGSAAGASGGESSQSQAAQAANTAGQSTEKAVKAEGGEAGAEETKAEPEVKPSEKEKAEAPGEAKEEKKEEKKEDKPPHRYHERLTKAFPDRKFEKSEDYDSALDEHLDHLESYHERGKKVNGELINLIDSNPEIGALLRDLKDGATVRQALARHIDPADLTPEDGDPDYEGWKKNKAEREEKLNKRREFEAQYADNLKAAEKELDEFAKENNLDEKAMEEFFDKTQGILDDFNNGKITKGLLLMIKRAFSYDADIKAAREEGVIAGRNEKIVAERERETDESGDGLPRLVGSSDITETDPQKDNYFAGLRKRMEDRGIINKDR